VFVEPGLDTDIRGTHGLLCEFADLLDGSRSSPLETYSMDPLVEVHGVVTGNYLVDGRLAGLFSLLLGHLD